jgi:hypothetical protein
LTRGRDYSEATTAQIDAGDRIALAVIELRLAGGATNRGGEKADGIPNTGMNF